MVDDNMDLTRSCLLFKILPLLAIFALTGCLKDKDNLDAYIAEVQSQQQADIPPIPIIKPYERFAYAAAELRDPFVPTVVELPQEEEVELAMHNGITPDTNRRREALEFFALTELQFVGTLEQEDIWALIRSPDSVIHKVQVGNYMGSNHGQILNINDSDIKLKEIVPEGKGYIERESSLSVIDVN